MNPKAVLFDCDGVIVDSEAARIDLMCKDFSRYGLDVSAAELEEISLGGTIWEAAEWAIGLGARLPDNWGRDFYTRLYALLENGVELVPGILTLLDRLDAAGVPYAVCSNGELAKMDITLGQHGLSERFAPHVYSGQALGRVKPEPDLFLHAAAQLGIAPADCAVVEDSATGARAARRAGMHCMGYAPHGDGASLTAQGAVLFDDMGTLFASLVN